MKKLIALLILLVSFAIYSPPDRQVQAAPDYGVCFVVDLPAQAIAPFAAFQEDVGGVVDVGVVEETPVGIAEPSTNFLLENWGALLLGLLAFIELIVRLTPTQKDNSIFNWIVTLINAILPNLKKGGGTYTVSSK